MASNDGSEEVKTTFDRISSGGSDSEFWSALGGLGLRGIRGESDRLEREKTLLNDTKRSLAFDHYRSVLCASSSGFFDRHSTNIEKTHKLKAISAHKVNKPVASFCI